MDIQASANINNIVDEIVHSSSSSSNLRSNNRLSKNQEEFQLYFDQKECQICHSQRNCKQLYLCDRCDDGYHLFCLGITNKPSKQQQWYCPICIQDLKQIQQLSNQIQSRQQNCYKCKKSLTKQQFYIQTLNQDNILQKILLKQLKNIKCLYCQKIFHEICFSDRKNSLNCATCQKKIRNSNPKNHLDFMKMVSNHLQLAQQLGFQSLKVEDLQSYIAKNTPNRQRFSKLNLQLPKLPTNWEAIVRYEASLAYVLTSKKILYTDSQLYKRNLIQIETNCSSKLFQCKELHKDDQLTFRKFLQYARKGLLGPYEIKEDRVKGFYLIATDYIQKNTIICQYVGEVLPTRQSLKDSNNDSIFSLIRATRSINSIDICPQKFGGICRFLSGINNANKQNFKKLENVRAIRFELDKKVRVIFFTKRKIQAGQTMYIDYNGTAFEQYPTDNFVQ